MKGKLDFYLRSDVVRLSLIGSKELPGCLIVKIMNESLQETFIQSLQDQKTQMGLKKINRRVKNKTQTFGESPFFSSNKQLDKFYRYHDNGANEKVKQR